MIPVIRRLATIVFVIVLAACSGAPGTKSTGQLIDDAAITTRVKTALIADPSTKAYQINVGTFKGEVQLSGFVDTQEAKLQAESVARLVSGVSLVRNDLVVK